MFAPILQVVSVFILLVIQKVGYAGIFFLMLLQSVNIPIPSEIIMPFSGFLVVKGIFHFWLVVLAGSLGNLAGALLSYYLASSLTENDFLARHRVLKVIFPPESIRAAENWFNKYGHSSIFFGRLVPVVSTFISFPAGLSKMRISVFASLTFAGSFLWSAILTWLGSILGENWEVLRVYFERFDYLILFLLVVSILFWIWRRFRSMESDLKTTL